METESKYIIDNLTSYDGNVLDVANMALRQLDEWACNATSLTELFNIHKAAIQLGLINANLDVNPYGIFRADTASHLTQDDVFLGDVGGIWTHTLSSAENGRYKNPNVYASDLAQYRHHLRSNFSAMLDTLGVAISREAEENRRTGLGAALLRREFPRRKYEFSNDRERLLSHYLKMTGTSDSVHHDILMSGLGELDIFSRIFKKAGVLSGETLDLTSVRTVISSHEWAGKREKYHFDTCKVFSDHILVQGSIYYDDTRKVDITIFPNGNMYGKSCYVNTGQSYPLSSEALHDIMSDSVLHNIFQVMDCQVTREKTFPGMDAIKNADGKGVFVNDKCMIVETENGYALRSPLGEDLLNGITFDAFSKPVDGISVIKVDDMFGLIDVWRGRPVDDQLKLFPYAGLMTLEGWSLIREDVRPDMFGEKFPYNFIDRNGEKLSRKGYTYANAFKDGRATVFIGKTSFEIDPKGVVTKVNSASEILEARERERQTGQIKI